MILDKIIPILLYLMLFTPIIMLCYTYSKEIFYYTLLKITGIKTEAVITEKIYPITGPGIRLIVFVFDLPHQHQIKVRQRVTIKTYNMLTIGNNINVLYITESPKIARIADVPKERAFLGYYSLFFVILCVAIYPISFVIILFLFVHIVRFALLRRQVNIGNEYFE